MANLPSFALSDAAPLFLWWHHRIHGYRPNLPAACRLSPPRARKMLDRGCWRSRSPQSGLGLPEASHPGTSWLQDVSFASPGPGPLWNLEPRSGQQTLPIAQPARVGRLRERKRRVLPTRGVSTGCDTVQSGCRSRKSGLQELPGAPPVILCVSWATATQIYTRRGWQVWQDTDSSALGGSWVASPHGSYKHYHFQTALWCENRWEALY